MDGSARVVIDYCRPGECLLSHESVVRRPVRRRFWHAHDRSTPHRPGNQRDAILVKKSRLVVCWHGYFHRRHPFFPPGHTKVSLCHFSTSWDSLRICTELENTRQRLPPPQLGYRYHGCRFRHLDPRSDRHGMRSNEPIPRPRVLAHTGRVRRLASVQILLRQHLPSSIINDSKEWDGTCST